MADIEKLQPNESTTKWRETINQTIDEKTRLEGEIVRLDGKIDERYTNEEILNGNSRNVLGIPTNSVPTDAFSRLGNLVPMLDWTLLQEYKTAGAFTFVVPDRVTKVGVYMIGGGGSGAFGGERFYNGQQYSITYANGGAAGYGHNFVLNVTPGQQLAVVVGAGGASLVSESWENSFAPRDGNNGGTTSFNGITVSGGDGGRTYEHTIYSDSTRIGVPSSGGQGTMEALDNAIKNEQNEFILYGSIPFRPVLYKYGDGNFSILRGGYTQQAIDSQNKFDPFMTTLCAGGFATGPTSVTRIARMPDGTSGGNGAGFYSDIATNAKADDATGNGNGGGGIYHAIRSGQTRITSISGAGSPGMVLIYKRRV